MAVGNASTIEVGLRVNDQGTAVVRKLGDAAEKAASQGKRAFQGFGRTMEDFNRRAARSMSTFKVGTSKAFDAVTLAAQNFTSSLGAVGSSMAGLGSGALALTVVFGGLTLGLAKGTMMASEWSRRMLRTEALVRATGQAAGFSAAELGEFAKARDLATLGDKDEMLDAINAMQTFKTVQGEIFKEAVERAQDLSTVFGSGLRGSVTQLGKALEDPVRGLTALKRVGVSFSESEKEMIGTMMEANRVAEAQGVILKVLAEQIGGAAEAEAGGLAGQIDTMNYKWRALLETMGRTEEASEGVGLINAGLDALSMMLDSGTIGGKLADVFGLVRGGGVPQWIMDTVTGLGELKAAREDDIAALKRAADMDAKARGIKKESIVAVEEEAEVLKAWREEMATIQAETTAGQMAELEARYSQVKAEMGTNYAEMLDLERWYQDQVRQIQMEAANGELALYRAVYEATGLEEYANRAIETHARILESKVQGWTEVLGSEQDAVAYMTALQNQYKTEVLGNINEITAAEAQAANDRISITAQGAQARADLEEQAARAISGFSEMAQAYREEFSANFSRRPASVVVSRPTYTAPVVSAPSYTAPATSSTLADYTTAVAEAVRETEKLTQGLADLVGEHTREKETILDMDAALEKLEDGTLDAATVLSDFRAELQGVESLMTDWESMVSSLEDYQTELERRDWSMGEYVSEFNRIARAISESEAGSEEHLEMVRDQLDVLKNIDSLSRQQLQEQTRLRASFAGVYGSLDSAIASLRMSEYAPVQSSGMYADRFGSLLQAAMASPDGVGDFISYATGEFQAFFGGYGSGSTAYQTAMTALETLRDAYGDLSAGEIPDWTGLANDLKEVGDQLDYLSGSAGTARGQMGGLAGATTGAGSAAQGTAGQYNSLSGATAGAGSAAYGAAGKMSNMSTAGTTLGDVLARQGVDAMKDLASQAGITSGKVSDTALTASNLAAAMSGTQANFTYISQLLGTMISNAQSGFSKVTTQFSVLIDNLEAIIKNEPTAVIPEGAPQVETPPPPVSYGGGTKLKTSSTGKKYWTEKWNNVPSHGTVTYEVWENGNWHWYTPSFHQWKQGDQAAPSWKEGNIRPYQFDSGPIYAAEGGILTRPVVAGEAGPEAFIPLTAQGVETFTRGIGFGPQEIAGAIVDAFVPVLRDLLDAFGGRGGGDLRVFLDTREIGRSLMRQDWFRDEIRRAARWRA